MSSHQSSQTKRAGLIENVMRAALENSTTAIFFHTFMAERIGLGAAEAKTLFLLSNQGPLTAGEIARHTGLTTPSVTSLIDRLENKGFVQRIRDSRDRRRVIVEQKPERIAEQHTLFGAFAQDFIDLIEPYSDEQLATIADFLTRASHYSQEYIASLRQRDEETAKAADDQKRQKP